MDPSRFFNGDGDLDFLTEDVPDLLKVLNEDIFKGALSVRDVRDLPRCSGRGGRGRLRCRW
jgi:hypothetical protein